GHARSFVDAAALRLDDAVLDLVGDAQTVASANGVCLVDERNGIRKPGAVDRNGTAALESYRDLLGGDLDVIAPGGDTHDRFDDVDPRAQFFEVFGLMRRAPDVRVRAVRLFNGVAVREAVRNQPLAHLLAPAQFADELRIEPRLVDAQ